MLLLLIPCLPRSSTPFFCSDIRINDCCKVSHVHGIICSFLNKFCVWDQLQGRRCKWGNCYPLLPAVHTVMLLQLMMMMMMTGISSTIKSLLKQSYSPLHSGSLVQMTDYHTDNHPPPVIPIAQSQPRNSGRAPPTTTQRFCSLCTSPCQWLSGPSRTFEIKLWICGTINYGSRPATTVTQHTLKETQQCLIRGPQKRRGNFWVLVITRQLAIKMSSPTWLLAGLVLLPWLLLLSGNCHKEDAAPVTRWRVLPLVYSPYRSSGKEGVLLVANSLVVELSAA